MVPLHVLVDYHNLASDMFQRGRRLTVADHDLLLSRILATAASLADGALRAGPAEILVRLYGGWFVTDDGRPSDDAETLGACLRRSYRPTRLGRHRVRVEMADALLVLRNEPLYRTLRQVPGFTAFNVGAVPASCPFSPGACPHLDALAEWRRYRCPDRRSCAVRSTDVVQAQSQKLVDSMLVTDATHLALELRETGWTTVWSLDDDMLPGVLLAAQLSSRVALIRLGKRIIPDSYDTLLQRNSVLLVDLP
jgi:hypothetical protein